MNIIESVTSHTSSLNQSWHEYSNDILVTKGRILLLIESLISHPQRSINWDKKKCQWKKYLLSFPYTAVCSFVESIWILCSNKFRDESEDGRSAYNFDELL